MEGSELTLDRATLASAVHDLRNPLAVIVGMTSVLRARAMPRDRDCLDAINMECNRISRMVDNLMAVARAANVGARDWIPADELASAAVGRLEGILTGTAVALEVPSDELVHVDPVLGELLLVNILELLAWPADGGVTLAITREDKRTLIQVHGTVAGAGAPCVNLMIAQKIAEAHGGSLERLEPAGGGTLIRVVLPDGAARPEPEVTP